MEESSKQENKMGTMPVNKLLITMALPMVISMLVQALYNVVDSIFVAKISENALTAVSMAFPLQNFMIAIASGTGVGVNAMLSKSLGEKNFKNANRAANNGVFLVLASFIIFAVVVLIGSRLYFTSQTDNEQIINYGVTYINICCGISIGIFGEIIFERILQSTGKTIYTMYTQGIGAIINIILDPILIFGYLGFPKMGIAGAATATVAGQIVAMILGIIFNLKFNKEIKLSIKGFRPHLATIKRIYSVGIPSIIMVSISSIMTYGLNLILIAFTETAVAVFGVYFKLQSFIFMPIFGINNGLVPIISYNFGAQKKTRILKAIKLAMMYVFCLMLIGFAAFQLIPEVLLGMFDATEHMINIGVPALRIISLSYLVAGFCIIIMTVFQAFGHGFKSMVVSVSRQLIVLLPAAFILSRFGKVDLVWWAFPIAEIASVSLSSIFFRRLYVQEIKPLPEE